MSTSEMTRPVTSSTSRVQHVDRKAGWGFWNGTLSGISWDRWRALLAENRVDPAYRHRAAILTARSVLNSIGRRLEERRFEPSVQRTQIEEAPLFVLGHWRGGTTHLHNLLACDTEQFAAPNTAQVMHPYTFLSTEGAMKWATARWLPRTRPMDSMAFSLDTPQEDEFALCLACLKSPYLGYVFPRRSDEFDRYLTFRDVSESEIEAWKSALLWFLKKVTLKRGRPLLLKSPTHTARIRLLLEIFPRARFVHIHRHPYSVFPSTVHLTKVFLSFHALQEATLDLEEQILNRYVRMYDAYFEQKTLIPEGQFHEVSYDGLVSDPIGEIHATYERLNLSGFERMRPALQEYVNSQAGFQKNQYRELESAQKARIRKAWGRSFDAWGYPA